MCPPINPVRFKVVHQFLAKINAAVAKIGAPKVVLPAWNQTHSEGEYNTYCGQQPGFLGFDEKMIPFGGGRSRFEFCDVLHFNTRTMYFAKIVSTSSGMSHLVEQVRRTSELCFAADPAFRRRLKTVFKKHHPHADRDWLDSRPVAEDWDLCLVSLGRSASTLPFFAKCGLVKVVRDLTARGHQVSYLRV